VGNYSEDDIKACARAFTGWTIGNTESMVLRSEHDSDWPYGRIAWHFERRADDHDAEEHITEYATVFPREGRGAEAPVLDMTLSVSTQL
jgi:uncharacterized protein (DUF1800 family)